eukprot:Skav203803  [mRNA]  locus=scaffold1300:10307:18992:- [translate_table: standard]
MVHRSSALRSVWLIRGCLDQCGRNNILSLLRQLAGGWYGYELGRWMLPLHALPALDEASLAGAPGMQLLQGLDVFGPQGRRRAADPEQTLRDEAVLGAEELYQLQEMMPQRRGSDGVLAAPASVTVDLRAVPAHLPAMSAFASLLLAGLSLVVAEESPSLRGSPSIYATEVACSGIGGFTSDKPVCYGGKILFQSYTLEVTNFDGTEGVVNMHADGAVSGQCDGAQFQSSGNQITIENDHGCGLSSNGLEYKVRYCPDQDHVIVNVMKPFGAQVVLTSIGCPDAGEV